MTSITVVKGQIPSSVFQIPHDWSLCTLGIYDWSFCTLAIIQIRLSAFCPIILPNCERGTVIVQIICSGCKCTMLGMWPPHWTYTDHVLGRLCTDAQVPHSTGSCISSQGELEELQCYLKLYFSEVIYTCNKSYNYKFKIYVV